MSLYGLSCLRIQKSGLENRRNSETESFCESGGGYVYEIFGCKCVTKENLVENLTKNGESLLCWGGGVISRAIRRNSGSFFGIQYSKLVDFILSLD